jgi:hypothetical protein
MRHVYAELKIHEVTPITFSTGWGSMWRNWAIPDTRISPSMGKNLAGVHDSPQEDRSGSIRIDGLKLQPSIFKRQIVVFSRSAGGGALFLLDRGRREKI